LLFDYLPDLVDGFRLIESVYFVFDSLHFGLEVCFADKPRLVFIEYSFQLFLDVFVHV